jgi:hypothetical protein
MVFPGERERNRRGARRNPDHAAKAKANTIMANCFQNPPGYLIP